MITRLHRRWGGATPDDGIAMVMVLGLMLTASVIIGAALSYAVAHQPQSRYAGSAVQALAAAQAGIDHYLAHLNEDRNYYGTTDCSNPALKGPNADPGVLTSSCGWNSSTSVGWVKVQPGDPKSASFHYDVDSTSMDQFTIWLSSTGRSGSVSRTLQAKISIAGSQRYLYVTDFEDGDPENTVMYPNGAKTECGGSGTTNAKYWWSPSPNKRVSDGSCQEISFADGDLLDGPVHFNDTPAVAGSATFQQGFTTFASTCTKGTTFTSATAARNKCFRGSGSPTLSAKGARWANFNALPDTTGDLVNKPGCQFTGDTRIVFKDDGTMDVWNTTSVGKTIGFVGNPAVVTSAPNCGTAANYKPATSKKYPAAKQNVPVPDDMVIYVKNSGSSATCTPGQVVNGTTSGSGSSDVIPTGSPTTGFVTDVSYYNPSKVTWTRGSSTWTAAITDDSHPPKFDCGLGNVYIEGTVKGRVTIAAENNLIVTGDLLIAGTSKGNSPSNDTSNVVGLVAQNSVVVYHPVSAAYSSTPNPSSGTSKVTCGSDPAVAPTGGKSGSTCTWTRGSYANITTYMSPPATHSDGKKHRWIYASIQTLAHSFWVASYSIPSGASQGTLSVRGSIAQRWRGAVGLVGGTGYIKDYSYDKRLQTTSPPYFPPWANGEWSAETTGEIPTPASIKTST